MRRFFYALALMLIAAAARPAAAEHLIVSLSNERVLVTSSFTGEKLVLFGTIEPSQDGGTVHPPYDLVVTVTGPRESFRTRRKQRIAGIWVNNASREFVEVPSYLAVLSNRPFAQIADKETLRRSQIGLDNFLLPQRFGTDIADTVPDDPFRLAFVRLKSEHHLYGEVPNAVTFLSPTAFRAAIPLPADVPTGSFVVDVRLFAHGKLAAQANSALEVIKAGLAQFVADAASDYGLIYGLATALFAVFIGWFASVVFKRD